MTSEFLYLPPGGPVPQNHRGYPIFACDIQVQAKRGDGTGATPEEAWRSALSTADEASWPEEPSILYSGTNKKPGALLGTIGGSFVSSYIVHGGGGYNATATCYRYRFLGLSSSCYLKLWWEKHEWVVDSEGVVTSTPSLEVESYTFGSSNGICLPASFDGKVDSGLTKTGWIEWTPTMPPEGEATPPARVFGTLGFTLKPVFFSMMPGWEYDEADPGKRWGCPRFSMWVPA